MQTSNVYRFGNFPRKMQLQERPELTLKTQPNAVSKC